MKTKHTPTPWKVQYGSIYQHESIGAARIASMDRGKDLTLPTERDANAAFIVDACNNYERVIAERDELARVLKLAKGAMYKPPVACQPYCPCLPCLIDISLAKIGGDSL
jgi:hypothetical protein